MKNVTIETDFVNPVSLVNCEQSQLKQVFVNVIKNAIEAMHDGGRLFVKLRMDNGEVYIDFTDEGEGIPKERIPRLGEPFFTTKEKGTGLGLMVSHKIISAHDGAMDISSELGKGTTVSILPCLETENSHF